MSRSRFSEKESEVAPRHTGFYGMFGQSQTPWQNSSKRLQTGGPDRVDFGKVVSAVAIAGFAAVVTQYFLWLGRWMQMLPNSTGEYTGIFNVANIARMVPLSHFIVLAAVNIWVLCGPRRSPWRAVGIAAGVLALSYWTNIFLSIYHQHGRAVWDIPSLWVQSELAKSPETLGVGTLSGVMACLAYFILMLAPLIDGLLLAKATKGRELDGA